MSIANSGHDERGKYTGGKAGDQTGSEWEIRSWYNRPWDCVLRYPDAAVREKIADWATRAAKNDHIGYDQNDRYTFWDHLVTSNYDPAQITVDCESDCSAGVLAIVKAVGFVMNIQALKNVSIYGYTGNMKSILTQAGFEVLTASKYLTGDSYLYAGDILLNIKSHTAINITTGSKAGEGGSTPSGDSTLLKKGSTGAKVIEMQQKLIQKGYSCGTYGADGEFGSATETALKKFQSDNGLDADGICGPKTWAALNAGSPSSSTLLKKGSKGSKVTEMQQKLIAKGYSCGSYGADGDFGSATESALKKFQSDNGLDADGICGPLTWAALNGGSTGTTVTVISHSGLNVRKGPGTNYSIKAVIDYNSTHTKTKSENGWSYLSDMDGWVSNEWIK